MSRRVTPQAFYAKLSTELLRLRLRDERDARLLAAVRRELEKRGALPQGGAQ